VQHEVQQPQQRLSHSIDPQQPWDLRQQPPPTTLPVVRIEGVKRYSATTHRSPEQSPWRALVEVAARSLQYSHDVKVRLLALSLAAWVAAYAWVYVKSMRDQGSTPYWWYLAIIGAGAVPPMLAAAGLRSKSVLVCGAVILGVTAVLALPSIGMLLLPGVVAVAALAVLSPRRS
jgi:hypothetical protein